MHVDPADQAHLPCHRIVATLSPTGDRALPLRMMSLLHQRGVTVVELRLGAARAEGATAARAAPGLFTVVFRSTTRHAGVVAAGFGNLVDVVDVDLVTDLAADLRGRRAASASVRP